LNSVVIAFLSCLSIALVYFVPSIEELRFYLGAILCTQVMIGNNSTKIRVAGIFLLFGSYFNGLPWEIYQSLVFFIGLYTLNKLDKRLRLDLVSVILVCFISLWLGLEKTGLPIFVMISFLVTSLFVLKEKSIPKFLSVFVLLLLGTLKVLPVTEIIIITILLFYDSICLEINSNKHSEILSPVFIVLFFMIFSVLNIKSIVELSILIFLLIPFWHLCKMLYFRRFNKWHSPMAIVGMIYFFMRSI